MRGAFKLFIAMLLGLLWLPATSHCALDAASDLITSVCASDCTHDEADSHSQPHPCITVESGNYTSTAAAAHAPAPTLTTLSCLARLHNLLLTDSSALAPPALAVEHPRDWIPSLVFTLRAAPPARAPSLV